MLYWMNCQNFKMGLFFLFFLKKIKLVELRQKREWYSFTLSLWPALPGMALCLLTSPAALATHISLNSCARISYTEGFMPHSPFKLHIEIIFISLENLDPWWGSWHPRQRKPCVWAWGMKPQRRGHPLVEMHFQQLVCHRAAASLQPSVKGAIKTFGQMRLTVHVDQRKRCTT